MEHFVIFCDTTNSITQQISGLVYDMSGREPFFTTDKKQAIEQLNYCKTQLPQHGQKYTICKLVMIKE